MKKEKRKNFIGFYLVAHQTHASPPSCSAAPTLIFLAASADLLLLPPLALRLGPRDRIFRASAAPPLGGVQRRRGSPRLGGGVGGSPSRLSPVASRPRFRPPRTGRRPCVRTSLSPPASAVPVGARPAAQGGRALAPPVLKTQACKLFNFL